MPLPVTIRTPYIQLGQFLKVVNLVQTGGEVKAFLVSNPIKVNQVHEQRRGRKLYPGDLIDVGQQQFQITGL
jgi:ribosome-associated protein YbcJ (S4-like RNA binding protein)